MSAFGTLTILHESRLDKLRVMTVSVVGTASYDTGGSVLNLAVNTGLGARVFTAIDGVIPIGTMTAGNDVYKFTYVRDTAGAPATGLLKVRDVSQAADAEVTSTTSLASGTYLFVIFGR